jgi:hypothetical protein
MKKGFTFTSVEDQYKDWLRTNPTKKYSESEKKKLDDELRKKISKELNITAEYGIQEFMLLHKWNEVREFVKNTDPKDIEEVEKLIWKPNFIF